MKRRTDMHGRVAEKITTFAAELQDTATEIILEHVDTLLAGVRERALTELRGLINGETATQDDAVETVRERDSKPAKPTPAAKKPRACSKCGKPGHRAPACDQDREDEPSPDLDKQRAARRVAIVRGAEKRSGAMPTPNASFEL